MQDYKCKILEMERLKVKGKTTYIIFRTEKPEGFEFKAGQYVLLGHPSLEHKDYKGQLFYRAYAIASAPHSELLEFCIVICYTGGLTEFLEKKLKVGDEIAMRGPFGYVFPFTEQEKLVFVVTGAGIAPAISMLRGIFHKHAKKRVQLFYGFPTCEQFLYRAELEKFASENENFSVYAASNKEGPCCWRGVCGYIQPTLEEAGMRDEEANYYLCGSPSSLKAMQVALKRMGIQQKRIHFIAG